MTFVTFVKRITILVALMAAFTGCRTSAPSTPTEVSPGMREMAPADTGPARLTPP